MDWQPAQDVPWIFPSGSQDTFQPRCNPELVKQLKNYVDNHNNEAPWFRYTVAHILLATLVWENPPIHCIL